MGGKAQARAEESSDVNSEMEDGNEDRQPTAPTIPHDTDGKVENKDDDEDDGMPGQWSPARLEPEEYVDVDVVSEQEDAMRTQLLRRQVCNHIRIKKVIVL